MEETVNEVEQNQDSTGSDSLSFPSPSKKDLGWILVGGGAVGALRHELPGPL